MEIEERTGANLEIIDNLVKIEGPVDGLLKAVNIVTAIGRGFSPEKTLVLLDEEIGIEVISLQGENESTRKRLFARVIGRAGQSKRIIEKQTGTLISVYGKTVSIIGRPENIARASHAINVLLDGKTHGYAYSLIEDKPKDKIKNE